MMMLNGTDEPCWVHDLLFRSAQRDPEAPFLIAPQRTYGYGEIENRCRQVARWLVSLDVQTGDRIALLATNTAEYVIAYYAISKLGAIAVPVNTAVDGPGLGFVLENCGVGIFLFEPGFSKTVATGMDSMSAEGSKAPDCYLMTKVPESCSDSDTGSEPEPSPDSDSPPAGPDATTEAIPSWAPAWIESTEPLERPEIPATEPASIIYTSGSTGRPRGATLSHANLLANTASIVSYLELTSKDRMMVILPFYYVYGKSLLNTHAAVGASLIIGTDLYFPNSVVKRMHKDGATGLAGVPSTFTVLLTRSKIAAEVPPTLRYLTQAGGAMAPDLTRKLMAQLPDIDLFVMYGATEAGARLSYLSPRDLPTRIGSIGKAIPGVTLRVVDESGREVGVDEPGELVAGGDNIMLGYWNDPDETALVLRDGELYPGDLARRDADGFLYIVGRKKEMIKSGAHRVSPKEIEETLVSHPRILEVAVIGVPDELVGEAILAFVVLESEDPPIEGTALIAWAAERLSEYKVPRRVEFREALPKNETGKIQKRVLRDELSIPGPDNLSG